MNEIKKQDHFEYSARGTVLISSQHCPLKPETIPCFIDNEGNLIPMCVIQGQLSPNYCCGYFDCVVIPLTGGPVKCLHPDFVK